MVSLGCGDAHIETSLISEFGWPVGSLLGLEYDAELRKSAAGRFEASDTTASFEFFDFNAPLDLGQFDIVFACHAIHDATDIELFLGSLDGLMREDSLFMGIEYLGPSRFQPTPEVRSYIQQLYGMLPEYMRRDLRKPDEPAPKKFPFATISEVREADISESVRSSDLRAMLLSNFPAIDIKPMGGTVLRWLLQYRAGHFEHDNPTHVAISRMAPLIEKTLIENRQIASDDLFFVLSKPENPLSTTTSS